MQLHYILLPIHYKVQVPVSPLNTKDKWWKSKDKSRKIKVLRDFFVLVPRHEGDTEKPRKDRVSLQNRYRKSVFSFCNDFEGKSLICRLLSIKCLLITDLLTVPLQLLVVTE